MSCLRRLVNNKWSMSKTHWLVIDTWFSEENTGPFPMLIRMLLVHCCPRWITSRRDRPPASSKTLQGFLDQQATWTTSRPMHRLRTLCYLHLIWDECNRPRRDHRHSKSETSKSNANKLSRLVLLNNRPSCFHRATCLRRLQSWWPRRDLNPWPSAWVDIPNWVAT